MRLNVFSFVFSSVLTVAACFALLQAESSSALDLGDQFLVYSEDFDDEFSFPADADVDLAGLGDVTAIGLFAATSLPTLNGKNAHAFVGGGVFNDSLHRVLTSATVDIPIESFAVRGRFDNLSTPPPNVSTFMVVRAALDPDVGFLALSVNGALEIDEIAGAAILSISETRVDAALTITTNKSDLILPNAAYQAIRNSSAAFTIDIELDRTNLTPTATATIDIEGQLSATIGPRSLSLVGSNDLESAQLDLSLAAPNADPTPAEIDFEELSVYFYFQSTFDVDSTLDENDSVPGDGACFDTSGACSLRAAIQEANAQPGPGLINVPSGTYNLLLFGPGDDIADEGDLDILDGLEIRGAGRATTIIDGVGRDRVFDVPSSAMDVPVRLRDLTIRNGFALANGSDTGGGLENHGRMALEHCVVDSNLAGQAGGISNARVLYVNDCVVRDNSTVSRFSSRRAGGIAGPAFGGVGSNHVTRIRNSAIIDNVDPSIGGAEFAGADSVRIENSTLSGDSGTLLQLTNSDAMLRHATLVGGSGKGLQVGSTGLAVTIEMTNTAIAGAPDCNLSGNSAITYVYDGNNASDDTGCGFTAPGSSENTNLLLGALAPIANSEAHVPQTGSPLIDAAGLGRCPVDDQVFSGRPTLGSPSGTLDCDIGAIEVPEPGRWALLVSGSLLLSGLAYRRRQSG